MIRTTTTNTSLAIVFLALFISTSLALDTCPSSTSTSTLYDSYLDPLIQYAAFSKQQNSYFKIPNPFNGQTLSTMSVIFWAKVPQVSVDGVSQSGTFVDCSETGVVRLSNDTLNFGVTNTSNGTSATATSTAFKSALPQLQQWNNYAFSFTSKILYIHLNGASQASKTSTQTTLVTSPTSCTIGNSLSLADPITAYIRHLLFSKQALNANSNIQNYIHHINLPTDTNTLAYFQFSSTFNYEQTYVHSIRASTDYASSNMYMSSNVEPEFVCYCTGTYPEYLQLNGNQQLNAFALKNTSVDAKGLAIDFTVFMTDPSNSQSSDVLVFSLENYVDIYFAQSLTQFRVDLYSSKGVITTSYLTTYSLRYNFWTQYTFNVTSTQIILYVNGALQYKTAFTAITLPSNVTNFAITSPTALSFMISSLAVRNSKSVNALSLNLTRNAMNSTYQASIISSGTISFGSSNSFCPMSTANQTIYWNGLSCIDNRLTPYFQGGSSSSLSTNSLLQTNLYSSRSTMTIELWIKDMNSLTQTRQVILENSQDGVNSLVQISITSGSSSSTSRSITCSPQITSQPQQDVTLSLVTTYTIWTHFSCVSSSSDNTLTTYLYNPSTTKTATSTSTSGIFLNIQGAIQTSLGSNILGSSLTKFQGYLKQLRIWSTARSAYQIQVFRYQIISSSNSDILHSFMLSDQIDALSIEGVGQNSATFSESGKYAPTISYLADKDLAICAPSFYHNGNCCQVFNISTVTFSIAYSATKNLITVSYDSSTLLNSNLNSSMRVNYSLTSVGNNFDYNNLGDDIDILTYLQNYFNQNSVQSFTVLANLVNPAAYSFTIQAIIYSDYDPTTYIVRTQTFVITCPNIWLYILPGQVITDYTQTVSEASSDTTPTINAKVAQECYEYTNGVLTLQSLDTTSVKWSWNISSLVFTNIYTLSSDATTATILSAKAKTTLINSNAYQLITVNFTYSGTKKVSTTIKLYYSPTLKINNTQSLALTSTVQMVQGLASSSISLDLSSFASSSSAYPLSYQMACPTSLFTSASLYNSLCSISNTGQFSLGATSIDSIGGTTPYYFNIYMIMSGTSIMQNYTLVLYVYLDGTENAACPGITMNSNYIFNQFISSSLTITTSSYLYCYTSFYSIVSANWTASDSKTGTNHTSIFSYGSQQQYTSAYVYTTSTSKVLAGAIVDVVLNLVLYNISTQVLIPETYTTQIYFSQNNLIPKVVAQNAKGTTLTVANGINFTESILVLNAQSSSDPDNSTAALSYSWACPDQINLYYTCSNLASSNGSTLSLTQYQRAKSQLLFNTYYTFTLTVSSVNNPYKSSQSTSFQVFFNPPSKSDSSYQVNSTCDSVSAPLGQGGIYYLNSTYPKLLRYDIINYTSVGYNINYNNTSSSCSKGSVVEQRMLFYVFDAGYYSSTAVPTVLFAQDTSSPLVNSSTISVSLNGMYGDMLAVTPSYYYQMNIYWYTVRQLSSGAQSVYLNIDTVYFSKTPASLVAQIATNVLTVDKYSDLIIDASSSYDPEGQNLNFYYKWTCPTKVTGCSSQNSSTLKVTPSDRASMNVNKATYTYSVIMSDGYRNSPSASASVTISLLDSYADCMTSYTNTDNFNGNYWASNNNTVYVQYNQSQSIQVMINASSNCQYATVSSTTFSSTSKSTYWANDTTYSNIVYITNALALKNLKTSATSNLNVLQYFIMGADTSSPYNSSSYLNFALNNPDLALVIKGQPVAVMNSTSTSNVIYMSSNTSSDTLKTTLTSYWTCPDYLGGSNCQISTSGSVLSMNYTYLSSLTSDITQYYDQSHKFILTLFSSDNLRYSQMSYYVYFASYGTLKSTSAVSCGISLANDTATQLKFSSMQTFTFSCTSTSFTNSVISGQTLTWSIDGLTLNTDYFQSKTALYLKAYSLQALQGADLNEMVVNLLITPNVTSPMKKSFKIVLPYMVMGSVSITSQSSSSSVSAYSQLYQLNFDNFQHSQYSGLQFQLRAYSKLQDANQIIFPIKQFSPYIINTLYSSFSMPYASTLKADFFDMNNNYMGTYNIYGNAFSSITLGSYQQTDFETALYSITAKTSSSYSNTVQGKLSFEIDIYMIKQLAESITNSIVSVSDSTYYSSYKNSILTYLNANFVSIISYFSSSSTTYDYQSRQVLERNFVYIMNSAFSKTNSLTNSQLSSLLSILDTVTGDYSAMIADGDEIEIMRQLLIGVFENMYTQLNTTSGSKSQFTKLTTYRSRVVGNDTSGLTAGTANSYFSGGSFRQVLLLQTNKSASSQSYGFQSQISSTEGVSISNQSYLSTLGISSLETTFQSSSNSSSPVSTTIYINAYDSSSSRLDVSFDSSDQTYLDSGISVELSFQATSSYMTLFENATEYEPVCSYYDTDASSWSTYGVSLVSYDSSTGIVTCETSHFSQFSIDYVSYIQSTDSTDPGTVGNNTNNTNSTNTTTEGFDYYYFEDHQGYFIAICVLTFVIITTAVAFSFKCSRTKIDYRMPNPKEWSTDFKFCDIYRETLFIHHSLVSATIGPKRGNIYLTMPQYIQMIFVQMYFFMVCILVEKIMVYKTTYDWTTLKMFTTCLAIYIVFYVLKSFAISANYYMIFRQYPMVKQEEKPKENGSFTEHQSLNEIKLDKSPSADQFEIQHEGGSEEDKSPQKQGVTSKKPQQSSKPHQSKAANKNQDKEHSIEDVDLDEIEVQIDKQSEYAFKSNMGKGASGGVGQHQNHQSFTRDDELHMHTDANKRSQRKNMDTSQDPSLGPYHERKKDLPNSGRVIIDMESQRQFQEDGPQLTENKLEHSKMRLSQVQQDDDVPGGEDKDQKQKDAEEEINKPPLPKNKFMKTCGTVSKVVFLYIKMIVTLYFVYGLPSYVDVYHFIRSLFGILALYEIFYEPIGIAIFALLLRKAKDPMSRCMRIAAIILFGNPHPNMILGPLYSLNHMAKKQ